MASARSATSAELRAPSWSHLSLIHRHSKSMRLRRSPRFERGSRVASSVRFRRVDLSTGAELNDLKQGRSRTTQPGGLFRSREEVEPDDGFEHAAVFFY